MFCCTLLYVHFSIAIILMGKRELIALLNLSSWCLVMVERLFLTVPRGCLQFVIVVFPDHTHLLFFTVVFFWDHGYPKSIYGNSNIFDMVPFGSRRPSGIFPDFDNPYVLMKPCTQFKSPMASLYAFIQPQRKPVRTGSWTEVTPLND